MATDQKNGATSINGCLCAKPRFGPTPKNYGDCECLTTCLDQIFEKPADGNGRIIYGYRSPSRGLDVIKELAEWKPIEYHGPIFPLPSSGADDKERWETELITLKRRFGFEGMPTGAHRNDKKFSFGRGPLAQLDSVLRTKYGYELGEFNWDEKPSGYLIYSQQLADKYRKFFYFIWDKL